MFNTKSQSEATTYVQLGPSAGLTITCNTTNRKEAMDTVGMVLKRLQDLQDDEKMNISISISFRKGADKVETFRYVDQSNS